LSGITLAPGPNSIVGRGLVIHADPDDYTTQPSGNSGARLACGVIRAS
jgi:Cu-Zn family superoxide dismutase